VLSRWQGGFAALVVTLVTGALVILEVTDESRTYMMMLPGRTGAYRPHPL